MNWLLKYFEELICSVAFFVMITVVIANVIARYLFSFTISFYEEVAFLGFTYSLFFGVCILYKNHGLIAIDAIVNRLPEKARRQVRILNFMLLTVVNLYLTYLSAVLAFRAWVRTTPFLGIPYTFVNLSAFISFALISIYSINFMVKSIKSKEDINDSLIDT